MVTSPAAIKVNGTGDYPSLTLFAAALPATLTQQQQADVYKNGATGLVEGSGVAFSGFTTTAAFNIVINVPVGERHNGTTHSGAFLVNAAGAFGATTLRIGSNVDHFEVHWLEVESLDTASGSATHWNLSCGATSVYKQTHCIIHGVSSVQENIFAANGHYTYQNNIIFSKNALRLVDARGVATFELSNCTLWTNGGDFPWLCDNNASNVVKNTYVGGASNLCFHGSFFGSGNNNAASDTSATANFSSSINSIAGATAFTSVTSGSEDFTTKTGFTTFNGAGVALGAVTDDIVGVARANPPCIGAFENVAAGGSIFSPYFYRTHVARMAA